MKKRRSIIRAPALALCCAVAAGNAAAQPAAVPTVGVLLFESPGGISQDAKAFRVGLAELGWVEGRNIVVELRFAEGSAQRLTGMVRELVARRVAAIVCIGTQTCRTVRDATSTIPVVMAGIGDPSGLVQSLARPGTNFTGTTLMMGDALEKQVELLKQTLPRLNRLAVLQLRGAGHGASFDRVQKFAATLAVEARAFEVASLGDFSSVFRDMVAAKMDAVLMLPNPALDGMREPAAEHARMHRLPSIGPFRQHAEAGFLMAYATSLPEAHRRAALYVDRILKGANPAELPLEQPTKFDLVINLKTATALGLTMPGAVMQRADEVIE